MTKMNEEHIKILYDVFTVSSTSTQDFRCLNYEMFELLANKIYEIGYLQGNLEGLGRSKEILEELIDKK
jgi:hypothetical protein